MGVAYAIIRPIAALITALFGGTIVNKLDKDSQGKIADNHEHDHEHDHKHEECCCHHEDHHTDNHKATFGQNLYRQRHSRCLKATHFCRCYYIGLESNIVDNVEFFRNIFNSIETLFLSLADGVNIVSPLSGNLAGLF